MRNSALVLLMCAMFTAPLMKADSILLTNDYGTGLANIPAYYVGGCISGASTCSGVDGYPYTVGSNTIPSGNIYISDPSGNVSDRISFTLSAPSSCSPTPPGGCGTELTNVQFNFATGLDQTGTPTTCLSVGGCAFIYDGSIQTLGTVTWAPGLFTPSPGFSTTLEYQSLIGTALTATLTNFQGGPHTNPVLLPSGAPVGSVSGTIGAFGTEDYYSFNWAGGAFSATISLVGTPAPPAGASYLFSEGMGSCTSGASATLNAADSFTGNISIANLAAGTYCIGLAANNPADPMYQVVFDTPVLGDTPEPSTFMLLAAGLGIGALRLRSRTR
jgi:hypothetical protein